MTGPAPWDKEPKPEKDKEGVETDISKTVRRQQRLVGEEDLECASSLMSRKNFQAETKVQLAGEEETALDGEWEDYTGGINYKQGIMNKKIAVPVDENGILDGHFGHCKFFAVLSADDKNVVEEKMLVPPPHEPGLLPKWLAEQGVTDVLAGGMGQKAIQIFNYNEVNVWVGAPQKSARELADGFLDSSIQFTANYCDH